MISSCWSLRGEPAELDERALWGRVLIVYVQVYWGDVWAAAAALSLLSRRSKGRIWIMQRDLTFWVSEGESNPLKLPYMRVMLRIMTIAACAVAVLWKMSLQL